MAASPPESAAEHAATAAHVGSAGHAGGVAPAATAGHPARAGHVGPHVSLRVLVATIVTLLTLTALTVGATVIDFGGAANLWIAMVIATVKATLVALYFMHLRYDRPFNAVVLLAALLFMVLFIGLTLTDTLQYRPDVERYRAEDATRYAPALERY
jgi:cytochrome c oxidase subunit 4